MGGILYLLRLIHKITISLHCNLWNFQFYFVSRKYVYYCLFKVTRLTILIFDIDLLLLLFFLVKPEEYGPFWQNCSLNDLSSWEPLHLGFASRCCSGGACFEHRCVHTPGDRTCTCSHWFKWCVATEDQRLFLVLSHSIILGQSDICSETLNYIKLWVCSILLETTLICGFDGRLDLVRPAMWKIASYSYHRFCLSSKLGLVCVALILCTLKLKPVTWPIFGFNLLDSVCHCFPALLGILGPFQHPTYLNIWALVYFYWMPLAACLWGVAPSCILLSLGDMLI